MFKQLLLENFYIFLQKNENQANADCCDDDENGWAAETSNSTHIHNE